MKRISSIGSLLKKIYRIYSQELLSQLEQKGFSDLRPSFLDILLYICYYEGSSIKEIGKACGLKKQTMTSHLNELEKRGYIKRMASELDKREQSIFLSSNGEKFKLCLFECIEDIESYYQKIIGEVELERTEHTLSNFYNKMMTARHNELPLG